MDREPPGWRKASYSNTQGSCVEVGAIRGAVVVRDTKQEGKPGRTALAFAPDDWHRFTQELRGM